ncbi:MAG: diacylglycerol/lipid kinase family protein [Fimbriimonas sp.]
MTRPILVIRNPASGRGRAERRWAEALPRFLEANATVVATERPGHATELARAAPAGSLVVAAGGDGTVAEVVQGLVGQNVDLAVMPLGTGNDLARSLGFGTDLAAATQAALEGEAHPIDLYRWTCGGRTGYAANVAGCGFDAVVARRINEGYRWLRGTQAYVAAVVESLARYQPTPIRIAVDHEIVETTAMLVAVANAQSYGGGMKVAPDALLDDGLLDVVIVEGLGRVAFLRAFPQVFRGTHVSHPKVRVLRGERVTVEAEPPLPVLADGELVGVTPASFEVVPGALRVMRA